MNSLIYKDYFYTASKASLEYYIVADGKVIFRGKSWRNPDTGLVKINIGDIVRDYMGFDLPDFRPLDDVVTRQEDAYKVFELYDANGVKIDEYKVLFDWYGEWNGEQKVLSNPIDGVLDPRMKILWTVFGPEAFDVIMESGPLTIDTFFRLISTNIVLGQEGGEYNIRWLTDYMPSSEWTVTIDGLTGFNYHDANYSGITIDFPRNDTVSAFTYDIYYHIHGLTFGPTHMTHNGGTLDINSNPIGGGSNSGDTEHIEWDSTFPAESITYSADTWIEVTNVTSEGCDITFKESNMSLEPRTGHVWIYINGELARTITVIQEGKYFRNMTKQITFPPSGGETVITWETDIPFAAITASTDSGDFTLSDLQQQSVSVATTGINMNYGYITGNVSVYSGTTLLGTTEIRQAGMYFNLIENPVNINAWEGSYLLHWNTNIPPEHISWHFYGDNINGTITGATQTDFVLTVHNSSWLDKMAYVDFYFSGDTLLETMTVNVKGNTGYNIETIGDLQIAGTEQYIGRIGNDSGYKVYDEDRKLWVSADEYFEGKNYHYVYPDFYFVSEFRAESLPIATISGTTYAKLINLQYTNKTYPGRNYSAYYIVLADPSKPIPIGETFTVEFQSGDIGKLNYVVTSQIKGSGYTTYHYWGYMIPEEVYDYANAFKIILHGENTEPNAIGNRYIEGSLDNDINARVLYGGGGVVYSWRGVKNYQGLIQSSFNIGLSWFQKHGDNFGEYDSPEVLTYAKSYEDSYEMNFSVAPSITISENQGLDIPVEKYVTAVTIDKTIRGLEINGMQLKANNPMFKAIYFKGTKDEFIAMEPNRYYRDSTPSTTEDKLNMVYVYCTDGTLGWLPSLYDASVEAEGHGIIKILN